MSVARVTSAVDIAGRGKKMTLDKAVAAKLAAQRGNEEAAALWKKLWAGYEKAGVEGVEALLDEILESPAAQEREDA